MLEYYYTNFCGNISGVAIGAGWQATVAYVNITCYYLFGIPLGLIMGYKLDMGVRVRVVMLSLFIFISDLLKKPYSFFSTCNTQGIWYGMMSGTVVQTCVLFLMVYKTNWNKEVIN